jgi:hypothetical protein
MSNMVLSSEQSEVAPGVEGWKRVFWRLAGVALATAVSLLVLNVAAQANSKASAEPPARSATP